MIQMAKYNKGVSKECNVEASKSNNTEGPESVHLKAFYMKTGKKFEYWQVDLMMQSVKFP